MAKLLADILSRALLAGVIAGIAVLSFDSIASMGESMKQSAAVLAFYIYCIIAVALPSEQKLFHVLSIPALTQFLHLLQKYTFTAGANSLWRLAPFLIVDMHLLDFALRQRPHLSQADRLLIASWIAVNLACLITSPNLSGIITGAFTLILITIPLYFIYLKTLLQIPFFRPELEKCLFTTFLILALGTLGLVFAGARYRGSDNLLVTRNISDTNVTMAYFILLWPFVLLFLRRSRYPVPGICVMAILFSTIVLLSFSRGALLITAPYIAGSLLLVLNMKRQILIAVMGIAALPYAMQLATMVNEDLAYSWQLRFADFQSLTPGIDRLQEASGRSEIHATAYALFLESPLYGHGIGSFEVLGTGYREAHSMFYTLLAEQGILGAIYMYALFGMLAFDLLKPAFSDNTFLLLLLAVVAYLVFVHSVGSVFVIIPAKSITINCIAPVLLLSIYFYGKSCERDRSL